MLKVIELFSGYGSQSLSLKYLNIPHEVVAISEINNTAIKAYDLLNGGGTNNLRDITTIEKLPLCDLLTYSFPCQDISVFGSRFGFEKDSNTRSSLLFEVERLLNEYNKESLPKYLLLENVYNILSTANIDNFNKWLKILVQKGYYNVTCVMDANDHGLPQSRKRVFVVSILKGNFQDFISPDPIKLKLKLSDLLEPVEDIDLKYYLPLRKLKYFTCNKKRAKNNWTRLSQFDVQKRPNADISRCLLTNYNSTSNTYIMEEYTDELLSNNLSNIRKLTPYECFKLQGLSEDDCKKLINSGITDNQLYQLAGNSIAINCLNAIFSSLFIDKRELIDDSNERNIFNID